jgi:hypothetical protein
MSMSMKVLIFSLIGFSKVADGMRFSWLRRPLVSDAWKHWMMADLLPAIQKILIDIWNN